MLESMFVAVIVLVAAGYAAWSITPAVSRNRLAMRLAHALGGVEAAGPRGLAARWLQKLAKAPAGGCSDCAANTLTPAERAQKDKPR